MTVTLLLFGLLGAAQAHPGWRDDAAQVVGDTVGVELALSRAGVSARSASVLAGRERWVSGFGNSVDKETMLRWTRIIGTEVLEGDAARGLSGRRHCTSIQGHDPVPGGRAVVLYPGRPNRTAEESHGDSPPALVLASEDGREFAFVQLLPGDTVQVVEGKHRGQRTERIEYTRGLQVLSLERTGKAIEACYSLNAEQ
jgi:hypothetical protein